MTNSLLQDWTNPVILCLAAVVLLMIGQQILIGRLADERLSDGTRRSWKSTALLYRTHMSLPLLAIVLSLFTTVSVLSGHFTSPYAVLLNEKGDITLAILVVGI